MEEEDDDATHWQSVTMDDEIQQLSEKGVNLTMSLGNMSFVDSFNLLVNVSTLSVF